MSKTMLLGVDFGSTNTCITYYDTANKEPRVIPDNDGSDLIATSVFFSKNSEEIIIGNTARRMLSSHFQENGIVIQSFKTLIGKSFSNLENSVKLKFLAMGIELISSKKDDILFKFIYNSQTKILSVVELVTLFLKTLKQHCCDYLSIYEFDIAITVPVYFDNHQRVILKMCFELAGFNHIDNIINEPSAAALSYATIRLIESKATAPTQNSVDIDSNNLLASTTESLSDEFIIVYDIGGYTTDISLVSIDMENEVYQVQCVHGNNDLGGELITLEMINYIMNYIEKMHRDSYSILENNSLIYQKCYKKLYKECEKIKKALSQSSTNNYTLYIDHFVPETNLDLTIQWNHAILRDCCSKFLQKQKQVLDKFLSQCIQSNSINTISQVSSIVLVGFTTNLYIIQEQLLQLFSLYGNDSITIYNKNIEKSVSFGACIQAHLSRNESIICQQFDGLLLEVLPLSLGIEINNGIMAPIISRNSLLPIKKSQMFTNKDDYIDKITISVYQGERRFVKDNVKLGTLVLNELDASRIRGSMKINITFEIGKDGILHIYAFDTGTKKQVSVIFEKEQVFNIDKKTIDTIINLAEKTKLSDYTLSKQLIIKEELEENLNLKLKKLKDLASVNDIRFLALNHICVELYYLIQQYKKYDPKELAVEKNKLDKSWFDVFMHNNSLNKPLLSINIFDLVKTPSHLSNLSI